MDRELTRGDTPAHFYKIKTPTLVAKNLTGCTIWWTAKTGFDDVGTDTTAALKHHIAIDATGTVTSSAGMTLGGTDPDTGTVVSGVASGVVTHRIPVADSNAIMPGEYIYDLAFRDNSTPSIYTTPIRGALLIVVPDVTRRTTTTP